MSLFSAKITKILNTKSLLTLIAGLLLAVFVQQLQSANVSAQTLDWLNPGYPQLDYSELPEDYMYPAASGENIDCDETNKRVKTREAKAISSFPFYQTEEYHWFKCGPATVMTLRGLSDGVALAAGDMAGKFIRGEGETILPVPKSNTLILLKEIEFYRNQVFVYRTIIPHYNDVTGEISYELGGSPEQITDGAGNPYIIRSNSIGYSNNGQWMVANTDRGTIRVNLSTLEAIPFSKIQNSSTAYNPGRRVAITNDGRYAAVTSTGQGDAFYVYDINTCSPVPMEVTEAVPCQYKSLDRLLREEYPHFLGQTYIRFATPDLIRFVSFYYVYEDGKVVDIKQISVKIAPNPNETDGTNPPDFTYPIADYIALGDSFSSGEGAYDYVSGTDVNENKCHLSQASYPYLAATELNITDFHSVACSGATSDDYYYSQSGKDYNDQNLLGEWLPGVKPQFEYLQMGGDPSVVTISMIGNDIGFADKLEACLIKAYTCFKYKEERESVADEIHSKYETLVLLYRHIRFKAPNAKIYVLGYPQIIGSGAKCDLNVLLDAEEREFARNLTTYLNSIVNAASQRAGVQYIDAEEAFSGYRLCEPGVKAVNGLTEGNDFFVKNIGPLGQESFHPNMLGHQLMAISLLDQSVNFTKPMPAADGSIQVPYRGSSQYNALIGDAPEGGKYRHLLYDATPLDKVYIRGAGINHFSDIDILLPNSSYEVWFNSEPTFAGTINTDAGGKLKGQISVPESLETGYHTMYIYGKNLTFEDIALYRTVYVAASAEDIDGDGIFNEDEKCLAVEPANVDADMDGIDDACDGQITAESAPGDTVAPVVTGTPKRQPDNGDWYNKDVTINWSSADPTPSSGEPTQPDSTVADKEGEHTYASGQSCDPANNCTTGSITIKLDKTDPVLSDLVWSKNPVPSSASTTLALNVSDATSGIAKAEYYLGEVDPGYGKGHPINISQGNTNLNFGSDLPSGEYKVTIRAMDNAGNWESLTTYLIVLAPANSRAIGHFNLVPSLANGDILPGLINDNQKDKAKIDFDIWYDKYGNLHKKSKFRLIYQTKHCEGIDLPDYLGLVEAIADKIACGAFGGKMSSKKLIIESKSIYWMTLNNENFKTATFQGKAKMNFDGEKSDVTFHISAIEGKPHSIKLDIFESSNEVLDGQPIYRLYSTVSTNSIKLR